MNDTQRKRLLELGANESLGRADRQPLVGRRFGRLLVTAEDGSRKDKRMVLAVCDCGAERRVRANGLLSGNTTGCGRCRAPRSHGHAKAKKQTRTYRIWTNMRARAAGQIGPENYSERGITVCDRWLSFENFLLDMGEAPDGLTLDRMDNNGNYEPDNCRWATLGEQARNRRNVRLYEMDGEQLCAKDWADRFGLEPQTVRYRLRTGKSIQQAIGATK